MADESARDLEDSQSWLGFLYSLRGRIPRKRYWLSYVLPFMFISLLAGIADYVIEQVAKARGEEIGSFISGLVSLFFLWPSFAVAAKRFHDRGMSGWWSLVANGFVPVVVLAIAAYWYWSARMKPETVAAADPTTVSVTVAVCVLLALTWLYFSIVVMFVRGQEGPNKYGDDPLPTPADVRSDRTVTAVFFVLTMLVVFLPIASYWYYSARMKAVHDETSPAVEQLDEGSADTPTPADGAPVDAPPAEEAAPPADTSPPPQ